MQRSFCVCMVKLLGHKDKVILLRVLYSLLHDMLIQVIGLSAPGITENKL